MKEVIDFPIDDGINTDIALEKVKKGMSRYRLNCISGSSLSGHMGMVENADGNQLCFIQLPTGNNTVIGTIEDTENNKVIYFVYNDLDNHSILRFDATTKIIEKILYSESILNFKKDYKITHADVIDGKLYWTDGYFNTYEYEVNGNLGFNPPRKINIERALGYTNCHKFIFEDNNFEQGAFVSFITNDPDITDYTYWSIGDKIWINQDKGFAFESYNGYTTITDIIASTSQIKIVTDKVWQGNSPANSGVIMKYVGNTQYYDIDFLLLDRIKKPPVFSPDILKNQSFNGINFDEGYGKDITKEINLLRGYLFQFAYRYVYDDYEKSVWSPISEVGLPNGQEIPIAVFSPDVQECNVIGFKLNTGRPNIIRLEIAMRQTNDFGTLERSNFFLIDRIDRYDEDKQLRLDVNGVPILPFDTTYNYLFYNNNANETLDNADQIRLFDYVPQVCHTQKVVHNNRLVDGNITEGYNNLDIDVNLALRYGTPMEVIDKPPTYLTVNLLGGTPEYFIPNDGQPYDVYEFTIDRVNGAIYTIQVNVGSHNPIIIDVNMTDQDANTTTWFWVLKERFRTALLKKSVNITQIYNFDSQSGSNVYLKLDLETTAYQNKFYIVRAGYKNHPAGIKGLVQIVYPDWQLSNGWQVKFLWKQNPVNNFATSLKTNVEENIGLVYYDRANRSGGTQVSETTSKFVPMLIMGVNYTQSKNFDININHTPPDWATHYQIVYAKNKITKFVQSISHVTQKSDGTLGFDVNAIITNTRVLNPKDITENWVWAKGDRLRVLGKVQNGQIIQPTKIVDVEIVSEEETTSDLITDFFDFPTLTGMPTTTANIVVEVYRMLQDNIDNDLYWEVSEEFEIGDAHLPTRYHKGTSQDQTSVLPAIINSIFSDIYIRIRYQYVSTNIVTFVCECDSVSDYYSSKLINIGRINTVIKDGKRQELKGALRFSHNFIDNSQINGLSRNDYDNIVYMPDKFNGIIDLEEVGYVLKVLQRNNITSIDIGRITTAEADGSSNVVLSGNALGTIRPSTQPYGCWHSESVCSTSRDMYFWDAKNNKVIKDSPNGMEAISDRGVNLIFRDVTKDFNGIYNYNCYSTYDSKLNYVIFSFVGKLSSSNDFTIAYHEPSNTWKTYFSFIPENMFCINNVFFTFKDGQLYTHDNPEKCIFYGNPIPYPMIIDVIFNPNYNFVKEFKAIEISSNINKYNAATPDECWSMPLIEVPPSTIYPKGQLSRLKSSKWKTIEGLMYSEFLRDMETPNNQNKLISGNQLRGAVIQTTLRINTNQKAILQFVTLTFNLSPPTNV